jgi:hypothetical protein
LPAAIRFLNADYGHGKTHFLGMINALALERNWVTSYVKLSAAEGVRLDKFDQLYTAILRNFLCRGLLAEHHQLYDPGQAHGWKWILDDWIRRQRQLHAGAGADKNSTGNRDRMLSALKVILNKANVAGDFGAAVQLYAASSFERNNDEHQELKAAVLRWFSCDKTPELRTHGVVNPITGKNAKQTLRSLIGLLREMGYGGLAFFIDEIENVLTKEYNKPKRQVAYQTLRELLDNIDGGVSGVGLSPAVCFLAATPHVFQGEKGFREYPALQDRIDEVRLALPELRGLVDYRAVVIKLAETPLGAKERRELAHKIRAVHAIAFAWEPATLVTDDQLDLIVADCEKRQAEQGGLRPLCKSVALVLDLVEQHRAKLAPNDTTAVVNRVLEKESRP